MADNAAAQDTRPSLPATLVELLEGSAPMGDLSQFAIPDLTPEEEDAFFQVLEDA